MKPNDNIICIGKPMIPAKCHNCGSDSIKTYEIWMVKLCCYELFYECNICEHGGNVPYEVISIGGHDINEKNN